jgi:hypothetical protein
MAIPPQLTPTEQAHLRRVAEKVKQATKQQADEVPLDQPLIDDKQPPEAPAASPSGKKLPPQPDAPGQAKTPSPESPLVQGYAVEDLLKTPLKPPEAKQTEDRRFTANRKVITLVGIGVLVAIIGIFLALVLQVIVGLLIAIVGAALIVASVFLPVR